MSTDSRENIPDPPPFPGAPQGGDPPGNDSSSISADHSGQSQGSPPPGGRSWERPWTMEEIRKGANNWSLAGDAGLLMLLQEFSQRMISQTHEIEKKVDGLVSETKSTGVSLNNVFNDFIMLANTQFVENRVYDEDVTQETEPANEKQDEKEKTREQRESELIPRVSEALSLGFSVIDTAFEKLDMNVGNSDSEDEDEPAYRGEIILEPKDPYLHRPLPYVIGTQAFLQDDDIGLADITSEEDAESDHGSLSESESESEEDEDIVKPSMQRRTIESESESEYTSSSEEESEEDLFGKAPEDKRIEDIEDYIAKAEAKKAAEPDDFASQLSAKLNAHAVDTGDGNVVREAEHRKEKDTRKKGDSKAKKEKDTAKEEALFGAQNDEDDDSPFSRKGGLFSGGGGLFDDDAEDEGGLFDDFISSKPKPVVEKTPAEEAKIQPEEETPSQQKTKSGNKVPTGGVSIFAGGDDDLFADLSSAKPKSSTQNLPAVTTQKKTAPSSGGLFDDDDDDLFATESVKKVEPKSQPKSQAKPVALSLFDDDDDGDLFAVPSKTVKPETEAVAAREEKKETLPKTTESGKKVPVGGVSLFGSAGNPLAAAIKAQRQQPHSDEEEDAWSEEDSGPPPDTNTKSVKTPAATPAVATTAGSKVPDRRDLHPSASSNSLFAEEPEDDLFAPKVKDNAKQQSSSNNSHQKGKSPAGPQGALFDDNADDDDLFSTASSQKTSKTNASKARSSSLFVEDDDADDIFTSSSSKVKDSKKKPAGGVALFGGSDLFAEAKNKVEKKEDNTVSKEAESNRSRTGTKVSLFDDDEADSSDLFSTGSAVPRPTSLATNKPTASKPRSKSKSLFEDEDVLFGGAEADPSVDLFGATSPLSPTQPIPKSEKPIERKSSVDNVDSKPGDSIKVAGTTTSTSSTDNPPGVKKATPPKVPLRRAEILKIAGATSTESSSDLFGGSPEESDLFSAKSGAAKSPSPSNAPGKFKKYAGAVSMFGGLDPSALVKKDQKESVAEPQDGGATSQPTSELPKPRSGSRSSLDGPLPFGNTAAAPSGFKSVSPPKPKSAVNKLQSDLSINTSALLPGSTPPGREPEPTSISFDKPVDVDTLHSVSKDRAKITTRRRPPTRKARQAGARLSGIDFTDSSTDVSPVSPPGGSLSSPESTNHVTGKTPTSVNQNDLFGVNSNDSLFKTSQSNTLAQKSDSSGVVNGRSSSLVDDDIFASSRKEQSKLFPTDSVHKQDTDDIFSSTKSTGTDIFNASKTNNSNKKSSVVTGQMDDIFANIKGVDDIAAKPAKTENADKSSKIKDLPEDDIFAGASVGIKKTIAQSKTEDVFSPRKDLKVPASSLPPEDDDIFASIPKEKPKPKKAMSKDEDLFTDNTDIFADLPPAKPREKKAAKKLAVTSDKPLFKDSIDDIFSDVKPKQKKSSQKKAAAAGAATAAAGPSIFDDSNVIDDPLSAAKH